MNQDSNICDESSHLEDDTLDESVDARGEDLGGALETPEDNAALAEDREEVEHLREGDGERRGKNFVDDVYEKPNLKTHRLRAPPTATREYTEFDVCNVCKLCI